MSLKQIFSITFFMAFVSHGTNAMFCRTRFLRQFPQLTTARAPWAKYVLPCALTAGALAITYHKKDLTEKPQTFAEAYERAWDAGTHLDYKHPLPLDEIEHILPLDEIIRLNDPTSLSAALDTCYDNVRWILTKKSLAFFQESPTLDPQVKVLISKGLIDGKILTDDPNSKNHDIVK